MLKKYFLTNLQGLICTLRGETVSLACGQFLVVACFWCQCFGDVNLMCFQIIFSSVLVAVWPSFGKELLSRLTICSLCILTICI